MYSNVIANVTIKSQYIHSAYAYMQRFIIVK